MCWTYGIGPDFCYLMSGSAQNEDAKHEKTLRHLTSGMFAGLLFKYK